MQMDEILTEIFEKQRKLGLSNQQLADSSGIPRTTLERIKRRETQNPGMQTVMDIAQAVGYQIGTPAAPAGEEDQTHMEHTIRMYEDRIARLRAHYNMLLTERNRWLTYCFITIGGLVLVIFLMVIFLITFIHS